ncbi:MAG TPA: glycosyltransferase family 9 protein [Roseiflexaceae bacterium]|nr:glycosyltransferase family 9 protein [Roseiflexaceae bacterium]
MVAAVPAEWRAARRVLAIRIDNLGDVLVTTPAIHAIRRSLPEAELTLLASPVGAQVGRLNPDLDDVLVYQSPQMDPWARLPHDSAREQQAIALLRERRFDAAVIFTSFRQCPLVPAYLCYLADIPLRAAASIEGPGSLLTTRHKHPEHMMHEVERGLDLVGALGMTTDETDLVLRVPADLRLTIADIRLDERRAAKRREGAGAWRGGGPLVVLHPGCSMPARTYPWEQFAQVADLLVEQLGARVALTGGPDERELTARVRGQMRQPALDLAGKLSFPELCALIEAADLTITNNTGPMHIAAALKTPVVALFALTNPPEQWGPWRVPHRLLFHEVPCRLCYSRACPYGHECLRLVAPEQVLAAAADLLAETAGEAAPALAATRSV